MAAARIISLALCFMSIYNEQLALGNYVRELYDKHTYTLFTKGIFCT
jgi:hypothetical protein